MPTALLQTAVRRLVVLGLLLALGAGFTIGLATWTLYEWMV